MAGPAAPAVWGTAASWHGECWCRAGAPWHRGAGGQGQCWPLGHCWGHWPPLQSWLVALGIPGQWADALKTSIKCITWAAVPLVRLPVGSMCPCGAEMGPWPSWRYLWVCQVGSRRAAGPCHPQPTALEGLTLARGRCH